MIPVVLYVASDRSRALALGSEPGELRVIHAEHIEAAERQLAVDTADAIVIEATPRASISELCARARIAAFTNRPIVLALGAEPARWQCAALAAGATACLDGGAGPDVIAAQIKALLAMAGGQLARAELASRESEDMLRLAMDSTGLGAFDFHPQTGRLVWDANAKQHFGVSPDADVTYDTFMRGVHPDDRPRVNEMVQNALRPESGGEYSTEYRTIGLEDRKERWLAARGRAFFDDEGRPVRFIGTTVDVTHQKAVEQALRESEARFRSMADGAPVVIWVTDENGGIRFVNRAFREFFEGASAAAAEGRWQVFIHPDDVDGFLESRERAVRQRTSFRSEVRVRRADGEWRWAASYAEPRFSSTGEFLGHAGISIDVTERKRSEEHIVALQEITAALSSAVTPDQVAEVVLGPGRRGLGAELAAFGVLAEGAGALDLLWAPDEINALPTWRRVPLDRRVMLAEAAQTGRTIVVSSAADYQRLYPDGTTGEFSSYSLGASVAAPLKVGDRVLGAIGYRFASAQRFTQADVALMDALAGQTAQALERSRLYEAAARSASDLREADRRKDEFIAILSHELRNPLAPIRYALPLIGREPLSQAGERAVAVIGRQTDHLTRLVDDLLDVSRISRGKFELHREHVTLDAVVQTAVEAASPGINAARHALTVDLADAPIMLHVDPPRVSQIITNLLNNSAKYTPRGGAIHLQARGENGHAIIRVKDNGIGIAPEALPTVFELFRQLRPSGAGASGGLGPHVQEGGLGIGLTLVKRLVDMHGGTIEARSAGVGRGSEFIVRLPTARAAVVPRQLEPRPVEPRRQRTLKVLVVDDNADLVDMLAVLVTASGHDVRKALDGQSALAAAIAYRPDVVLLDLGLPVMSGVDVARELRRRAETRHARIVAVTGWGQIEDRRQTLEAGFDHHLTKPTDPDTLERLLAEFAAEHRP